ncbi:24033_t:CDS:2, partial [Gigaspora rosea]
GVSESCKKVSNKIKFIMSLDGLLTVIKKPSMISHEKMRPVFERPSWKFQNFEACNSMLINLTGYVGFDYIGTYLLHEEIYYVAYSDNRKAPRGVLEE